MDERRETHDFMNVNVESFSQLPFIRRTPPSSKEKASIIRLFGKELVGDNNNNSSDNNDSSSSETTTTKNDVVVDESSDQNVKNEKDKEKEKDSSNSNNRRFECHYCFRNFPTSQALGGHQNAHKRERQHAKRGSMTSSYFHHQPHDHTVYGFLNNHHHRLYPSWTSESRFYGGGGGSGGGQQQQHQTSSSYYSRTLPPPTHPPPPTINGSPLGLWRVPPSTSATAVQNVYSSAPTSSFRSTSEQETNWPYRLMKPNVQDHVSLDLHL